MTIDDALAFLTEQHDRGRDIVDSGILSDLIDKSNPPACILWTIEDVRIAVAKRRLPRGYTRDEVVAKVSKLVDWKGVMQDCSAGNEHITDAVTEVLTKLIAKKG